jgi:inosose dehydratase
MDVVSIFKKYGSRIRHVHINDINANHSWTEMGSGIIDFNSIVDNLKAAGYDGWITMDDESLRAESQPNQVTFDNGQYLKANGLF